MTRPSILVNAKDVGCKCCRQCVWEDLADDYQCLHGGPFGGGYVDTQGNEIRFSDDDSGSVSHG